MKSGTALLLAFVLLATAALVLVSQASVDPLAQYRAPDGSLHIPGGALTPDLQRLLFGGNDLQPFVNLSRYVPATSPYATMQLVERGYLTPNPNVFARPAREPETVGRAIAHLVARWFPPVDWGAQVRGVTSWLFGLFTFDARAAVTVDSTTVFDVTSAANTCATSQTAVAADNAILVMLSERGTATFGTVTYGAVTLTLIAGTGANGGTLVRTEIWGFAGSVPGGLQTMTATLSGGSTARMTCATILLQGVKSTGSFINGTSNALNGTNATVTFTAAIGTGNLGFAVAALQNGGTSVQPTAVTGTGAAATDLYGVTVGHCTAGGAANECAAGADIPSSGTAITWTNPSTQWVVSAVEVVATPTCGSVGGGNCYRVGAGGNWNSTANWSNTPGGASCACSPLSTDFAFFTATPTGTTSLVAATTIAGIDMTGFTGTLDTTASNWSLTVNGAFAIQGTFVARGSTVTVTGNVTVLGAATVMTMGTSAWTVNGTWTNNSTSATWSAGTSSVAIKDAVSGTLTFANLSGGTNEFNNLTLDASVAAGLAYTMATNGLRMGGTLTLQNSTAGATGSTVLDTSASNLAVIVGALTVSTLGALNTEASTVTVNGNVNVSSANAYVATTGGAWVVVGSWTDSSTSASWSFAASMNFRSTVSRTMTFGGQAGNEFAGAITFDTTVTTAVTYTMATRSLDAGGVLTIQNSAAGATGAVTLDTSAGNLAVTAGGLALSTLGTFNSRASTITINGDAGISAATAFVTNTGGTWTVAGAWTDRTTSASWSFAAAMTFRAAAAKTMTFTGSNIAGNEFAGAVTFDTTAVGGIVYTMAAGATGDASLKVGVALTIRNSAGGATAATILDTSAGNYAVTAASLTLGNPRGALRSEGSIITINGSVSVSDANSYLVLGTAAWTVTGTWTNGSTDAVDWSAGTGTVTFKDVASASMTFANLGASEFSNVVFDTTTAAGITYTMATNGLRAAGTLTVQNTAPTPSGNVVLTTGANLAITAGGIVFGANGTLTANASVLTVNGSWTSTAANHVWTKGTSTVVFGATGTVTTSAGDSFNNLTQSAGTTTLGSAVTVSGATTVNGTLDTSASNFALTMQSTLAIGASGVLNLEASTASTSGNVTIAAGGAVKFTGSGAWTINGSWADSNASAPANWAVGTSTVSLVGAAAATLTFWTAPATSEFNNLILDSSAAAGFTYTQVNALQTAGTLTVRNTAAGATGAVVFDATATNYASTLGGLALGVLGGYSSRGATVAVNGSVSVATNGYITNGAGSWTVTGAWTNNTTSASWSFSAPVTFRSATGQTMTFKAAPTEFGGAITFDTTLAAGVTYTLATNGLTLAGLLTVRNSVALPTGNTVLDTSGSSLGVTAGSVTLGTNGTLLAEGSTISVGGNWTATAANATFTAGTSTVAFTATASVNMTQSFYNLTITTGTATLAANTTATGTVTVSSGILAKGTATLSAGALTLSGGALTSTSGAGTVGGNVSISSAASYIAFGSETWTIGGSWTNSSTSGSWSAGTGTVVFNDASSATMTFAGTSLGGNEFANVTFDTTAAAGVTFTLSARGLRLGGTLTVQNSSAGATGPAVLDTSASNLPVTAGAVVVGTNGTVSAKGSTLTVSGNWTATAVNATFLAGTSTVALTANATVTMTQAFYNLTVTAGTVTAGSGITVSNALTVSGGTFAKATSTLSLGSLTLSGGALTSTSGAVGIAGNVNVSAATSYIAFGSEAWTVSGAWTNASTSASWNPGTGSMTFNASSAETMTFAGSNLAGSEFANVTFNAGTATVTFALAARGLRVGATLSIAGGAGVTTLDTSVSSLPLTVPALSVAAGGVLVANGSTITVTSIDTHLGAFNPGSSTILVNASGGAIDISQTANNLTVNPTLSTTFSGSFSWSGTLTLTNTTIAFGASGLTSSGPAAMAFASATITMGTGSWDTSSAATFTSTGSTVTFSGTGSLATGAGAAFAVLTVSGGVRTLTAPLTTSGLLTLSGGILAKASNALTAGAGLALSGGALTSSSGTVIVTGNVVISAAASYIAFGSESWTVSGSWTNASTSTSWAVGTAAVTFDSASSRTMTFAALPGASPEFYNVTFNGGAASVTFTLATNALVWSGTLSVAGGSGTTTLAPGNLALTGGSLSVGNAGIMTANASAVSVSNVTMTGGTSGSLVITTGAWTVAGSWDTSGAGSSLSAGTSTVTFTGASGTIAMAPGQSFYNLTIGGTEALASLVAVSATLTVNNGAVLTKTGKSLAFNALAENGTGSIDDGTVVVQNLTITNSDATNLTMISVFSAWTVGLHYNWTHTSSVLTSTITFTIGGNGAGNRYNVLKDGALFYQGTVNASGQIVFTMLGSDPVVDIAVAAPCGAARYWVGAGGNWSDKTHWSSASGNTGGCSVPTSSTTVFIDSGSGSGTITLDQDGAVSSLDTTGWTGTLVLGAFNLTVTGNLVHAGGTITIGASASSGLSIAGNLTLSGSAVLDGSGAASLVSVSGNVAVTSATAYVRMGSGAWTFSGSWSNASTSASWSAGTGTVVFNAAASQTMTFANLTVGEFYNVTFASTAATGATTFTMGTNPLRWNGLLTIQDSAGSTTALATANLGLVGGSLTVGTAGILTTNASTVSVANVSVNGGTSGVLTLTSGTWTVSGSWDTSGAGSVFTKGTSTVILSGASQTVTVLNPANGFYNLAVSGTVTAASAIDVSGTLAVTGTLTTAGNSITGGASLVISGGGTLAATTSVLAFASVTMNDTAADTLSLTSGSISVSGSWDTSGTSVSFLAGTSTVTLSAASGTVDLGATQAFASLVITGNLTQTSQLTAATLTIPSGGLSKAAFALTVNGDLVLSGGYLTSVSGGAAVGGNVDISATTSYMALGSGTWTVSGNWTNTSTSASWSGGTSTVTFNAGSSQTMTFAGTHLSGNEFNAVVFNGGAATVTFTMASASLVAHSITVLGASGTTTLSTSGGNWALTADTLTVAAGGALTANGSVITIGSMDTSAGGFASGTSVVVVAASGGSVNIPQVLNGLTVSPGISTSFASGTSWSGALTLTGATATFLGALTAVGAATLAFGSSTITVAGSWDTTSTTAFAATGSSVTFTGSGRTIALGPGQRFATLTIAGTLALASDLAASTLTVSTSAALTKTGHGITFNTLAVDGTVADGTVNVSNLTVANSDATALITISVFTTWSAGSDYAWTHASSETSQTITWTIRGNTSGYLYTVTKDGASFASGTVDSSGRVVFTMTGSDPDMRVTVAPPPWWTAPYIVAIPPIALLVVVGMFVQRQRFRPTKAFLVDERGQMLREFTLDPSCNVTYEQAVQAGALDAREKDIKVSKYHARAVRGDALAVVLLAYGPVSLSEVEFAREILVNVQDKFEDRVKERLEEARATEANLGERRQQVEAAEADHAARAQEIETASAALAQSQERLASDTEALAAQSGDLEEREKSLASGRAQVDKLAKDLEKQRATLYERTADLADREREVTMTLQGLEAREAALAPQEAALTQRERDAAKAEAERKDREEALATGAAKLARDREALAAKEKELIQRDRDLADERKALDDLTVEFVSERKALDAKTADLGDRETTLAQRTQDMEGREAAAKSKEDSLAPREAELASKEAGLRKRSEALAIQEASLAAETTALAARKAEAEKAAAALARDRQAVQRERQELSLQKHALDGERAEVNERTETVTKKLQNLEELQQNLGPRENAVLDKEKDLAARANGLTVREQALQDQRALVDAKTLEAQKLSEELARREETLTNDRALLEEARAAFSEDRKDLETKMAAFEDEMKHRRTELDGEGQALGEQRLRLVREKDDFEGMRREKSQWIASKDIELEAREQSLTEKEAAVRAQAEENGRALADLAAREETLEIESDKLDKERKEMEARRADLAALAKDTEAKAAKVREDEARKAEELRTWQATIESEQALLREQKETFEKDSQELRESWAGRMLRVEQREQELTDREAKTQADVEWVARNEDDVTRREKALADAHKAHATQKADLEKLQKDLEQRAMEVESRERAVREEAARVSVELQKRTEAVTAAEADLAGRRAQTEQEFAGRAQRLSETEEELKRRALGLTNQAADIDAHRGELATLKASLDQEQDRLARERADLLSLGKQLEGKQLELAQLKEKQDADATRIRAETEASRHSLAAKEADLRSERERLERESSALQDKLGTKAQELASREKSLDAREQEFRSEEQDLETRTREIESRDRQVTARTAELDGRTAGLDRREQELAARSSQFDVSVQKFQADAASKRKEWEQLQATLKAQEAQLAASAENRQAEIAKRMEDLEQRERSVAATMTQMQIERSRMESESKTLNARKAEIDGAMGRSDRRAVELKAMEDDLLRSRQGFEAERASWAAKRAEELKQLEATRDAAAEQTQQSEKLIEDAQRRAYVASEAEKSAKRQMEELTARVAQLDARRVDAEKAEKALQAQMVQLQAASQQLGAKESELVSRGRELDARQTKLAAVEQANAGTADELKARRATLDQEAARLGTQAGELERRRTEEDARHTAVEAKLAQVAERDENLTVELQRANDLMEDLARKEAAIVSREKSFEPKEADLGKRQEALARRERELLESMQALEKMKQESASLAAKIEEEHRAVATVHQEATSVREEADRMKAQAESMQAEVSKNMKFLQKKALDVLDREEKIRVRESKAEESTRTLDMRAEILENKEKALEVERGDMTQKLEKIRAENEKLKGRLAEAKEAGKATADMEDWKRDIDNRVKIIQRKALELLDREEKLRKREDELKALEAKLQAAGQVPSK